MNMRHILLLTLSGILAFATTAFADIKDGPALEAPPVNLDPGPEYAPADREFQGIPGIARAPEGRLWATWYTGGEGEGPENYVVLKTSGDDGATWSDDVLVIDPADPVRAYDPCLWVDPEGVLWLFWAQAYQWWDGRGGVWCITTDEPDKAGPGWSEPRRIADGVMMNKPTALDTGEWLFPIAGWRNTGSKAPEEYTHDVGDRGGSNVYISTDQGETIEFLGQALVPETTYDEHMIVERADDSLWMLVRTRYGIGMSTSTDRGKTWTSGEPSGIPHPSARFHIRRLDSGNLLLVRHNPPDEKTRSHLTAYLSEDDGKSWKGGLVVDERKGVSYPDTVQAADGTIYCIYDFERRGARHILMATFTEEDIRAKDWISDAARQRVVVEDAG
ncbi:MAG: sialidase family protein [Candidatus Hydrogenedentota bacterium]